jgi:hypothetical protein
VAGGRVITVKLINQIADHFKDSLEYIEKAPAQHQEDYMLQWKDDVCGLARIIFKNIKNYDIEMFYDRCGYKGSHPEHI